MLIQPFTRNDLFRKRIAYALALPAFMDDETVPLAQLMPHINEGLSAGTLFREEEATKALEAMTAVDELLYSDGTIYKV